jgi:RimJ/RimL family protein N-acetyltransferase
MQSVTASTHQQNSPPVRPLRESDLPEADRIFRLAFGTFIGLPDPMMFAAGCDFIRNRWRAAPHQTMSVEVDGRLAGSNLLTRWGSFGFFGPLTVRPDLWERGLAKTLLRATTDMFDEWNLKHAGLFTFPHSPKHIGLYQKFGFWPRFLTALMSKTPSASPELPNEFCFSKLSAEERATALQECRSLADEILPGLDLTSEIRAVHEQALGETILAWNDSRLAGFAVCHCGTGTEAGPETCYVKFAVARGGVNAAKNFGKLLDACEALARSRSLTRLRTGVNMESSQAYRETLARGFRIEIQGVAMHRNDEPGFCRADIFALGDWR